MFIRRPGSPVKVYPPIGYQPREKPPAISPLSHQPNEDSAGYDTILWKFATTFVCTSRID